jgi:hypothetical protein
MHPREDAMEGARSAYMAHKHDKDVITVKEAATLVDRTVATVKKWIKTGGLEGHRRDPENNRSALLVSRADLMTYVVTAGKKADTGRVRSSSSGPSKAVLQAELEGQKTLTHALRAQLDLIDAQMRLIEEGKRTQRERADEWKDRAKALEAELHALRMHAGLPWWRRLLTTTAPPADAVAIPVGAK